MTLLSFLLHRSRLTTVILILLTGFMAGASNAGLLALINTVVSNIHSPKTVLIWSFGGLCLVMLFGKLVSQIMLVSLSQGALFDIRMKLSRQILSSPLRLLEETGKPRLMAALTEDIFAINNAVVTIPMLCMQIATVTGGLIYLGWLNWVILLWTLGFIAVGAATYQLPMMRVSRYLRLGREQGIALIKHFRTIIDGTKELKLHRRRREAFLTQELQASAADYHRHIFIANTTATAAAGWGQLLFFIAIGLLIFLVPAWKPVEVTTLTGYVLTILYLMNPLQYILDTIPTLGRAQISIKKIQEMGLSLARSTEEIGTEEIAEPSWQSVKLSNVTHSYQGERGEDFVLGPIDLTFHAGELIFLTGGNGSGKTTLAKIVIGLYLPQSGNIIWDGKLITDKMRENYRQLFSVVFSDYYLFDKLLGLDRPEIDIQAREYLELLQLDRKVQIKDGLLSTIDLSQGQRKRLALLTAYLEDRPIYLFDEWAADQDPMFKEIFYLHLLPSLKARGKTVIVISHDDRYYDVADRIIKLDYGKIEFDKSLNESERASIDSYVEESKILEMDLAT